MHKVLITGSSGFTGKYLAKYLKQQADIVVTGIDINDNPETVCDKFHHIDLLNLDQITDILKTEQPDYIIHLTGINKSSDFKEYYRLNTFTTTNLLDAVLKSKLDDVKMLFVSSSAVYGNSDLREVDEQSPVNPVNFYGNSKLAMEHVVYQYHFNYNLKTYLVRPFNLIGPGQDTSFAIPNFINQVLDIQHTDKNPVINTGNLSSYRDFIDVRDAVAGYWRILTEGTAGEIYNISSGKAIQISDVLQKIIKIVGVGSEVKINSGKPGPKDIQFLSGKSKKIIDIGWQPVVQFEESINDMITYIRESNE